MVTVSSVSQTKPSVPFIVSQCGPPTDGLLTFGCVTSGFFPESLEMEWTLGSGSKSSEVQFPAMKSQSNSFTAVSQVQINATTWTNNSLTCTVKHPAGSETATLKGRRNYI
ncbi:Ig heavy chain Mem5-like [Astyanax mexicanus]|uniref:Ig heavy chain Mem5-like n=1 Tax=Astyanax mexicanus TaxID=7994 RepID=UPI0020CB4075|nr:Ig heavy chain Mem5-like [Astyanax mexicanus]